MNFVLRVPFEILNALLSWYHTLFRWFILENRVALGLGVFVLIVVASVGLKHEESRNRRILRGLWVLFLVFCLLVILGVETANFQMLSLF